MNSRSTRREMLLGAAAGAAFLPRWAAAEATTTKSTRHGRVDYKSVTEQVAALRARQVSARERSEERRVGKECSLLCRSRWSPYH